MKKFLKHYNGWLGFVVGTLLFFAAPPFYHFFDPTAAQYDAGYIHPIFYSMTVISFATGFAWLMMKLTAPGLHKRWDSFLESENKDMDASFAIRWAFAMYFFYVIMYVVLIASLL